ncbi:MAG: aldolase [Planctomycetaceae bacterium]|nr:aldolase [Planctomycetaceae bacterium]
MIRNSVKQKLRDGGVSIGTMMFEFNTTGIARIAANAGAEFAVYDMEHSGWSIETIRMLIATTPKSEMVPIVRIPATEYHFVANVLDIGAMGVMVPMCENADQARLLVGSAKYPPDGRRGAAFSIAHDDYCGGSIPDTVRSANDETLLIAQIETARGLDNVEEIAAVPGIDALWIGLYDLTSSLGIAGQMTHQDVQAATDRVFAACQANGKTPAVLVNSVAEGQGQLKRGFRLIAYGGDLWIYQAALRHAISQLKGTELEGG